MSGQTAGADREGCLGVLLSTPLSARLRRRILAGALALAINATLIVLLAILPRPEPPDIERESVDIVFVELAPPPPPEPEIQLDPEPDSVPEIEPEPETEIETEPEAEFPVEAEIPIEAAPPSEALTALPDEEEDEGNQPSAGGFAPTRPSLADLDRYGVQALPYNPSGNTVHDVLCMATSEATRRAAACPPGTDEDGLPMLQYASPENLARARAAFNLGSADEIRALFGEGPALGLADLAGQPTLADGSERPTSSSDEMRDTLPPRHPDPAFGD